MADARTSPGSRVVPRVSPDAQRALDVTLGLAGMTVGAAVVAVRTAHRVTAPVTRLLWRPPLLPRSLHPATILEEAARTGRAEQVALRRRFEVLLDAWAPVLVEAVVELARFTVHAVQPAAWKRFVGLIGEDKRQACKVAATLYPTARPMLERVADHNRADALLLAHYGRRCLA